MSPYIVEASRQGFELSFWEKLTSSSFEDGAFRMGTLQARATPGWLHAVHPAAACVAKVAYSAPGHKAAHMHCKR